MGRSFASWIDKTCAAAFAACCAVLITPSVAIAQATAPVQARTQIVDPTALIRERDLDFGGVFVTANGRIDMTAEEVADCTSTGGVTIVTPCQSAKFSAFVAPGAQARITVPPRRRINLTGPGRDLRLRRMSVRPGTGATFIRRVNRNFDLTVTDPNGEFEFFVAGRLLFRNNQAPGVYTGTFLTETDFQ